MQSPDVIQTTVFQIRAGLQRHPSRRLCLCQPVAVVVYSTLVFLLAQIAVAGPLAGAAEAQKLQTFGYLCLGSRPQGPRIKIVIGLTDAERC